MLDVVGEPCDHSVVARIDWSGFLGALVQRVLAFRRSTILWSLIGILQLLGGANSASSAVLCLACLLVT